VLLVVQEVPLLLLLVLVQQWAQEQVPLQAGL
jgi:hypothetical protein